MKYGISRKFLFEILNSLEAFPNKDSKEKFYR